MSLIAVPIFIGGVDEVEPAMDRARDAVKRGARLIEWRVDALAEDDAGTRSVLRLVRESPAPCIVTCRCAREGGAFEGNEAGRIALVRAIAESEEKPRYIDIELAALMRDFRWRELINELHAAQRNQDIQTGIIFSVHDFERRPPDLIQRIEAMAADPTCAVIKVVWRARSIRDNLEAFDLLANRHKPMIALCMGPFGLMSRVLAPKFGGLLSFATDAPGSESAPGQPTVEELRGLYNFEAIGPETKVYGVIGWPVEHSLSPRVHNAAFAATEHDAVYLPMPVPPEWEHFKATLGALIDHPRLNFRGASVTIPHKHNLLRFVEERGGRVEPLAEQIGAANTLMVGSTGALACSNTDAPAAVEAVCEGIGIEEEALAKKVVAVIGAGGVARAVVAGLSRAGAKVVIFNRDPVRAEEAAALFHARETVRGERAHVVADRMESLNCACFDVIVNCTPIGMAGGPDPHGLPLALDGMADKALDSTVAVFDTVYTPIETPLIQQARSRGAVTITGEKMFLKQAAKQFHQWTARDAPLNVFKRAMTAEARRAQGSRG